MIVTGASAGIGRALAELAVRAGFRVLAVGRRAERLAELERLVAEAPGGLVSLTLDLREPRAPERIVRETLQRFGRIDVLVNNAGGVGVGPISQQSDVALREQFETHAIVPLALVREALPELRRNRGQIFFYGSGVARIPVGALGAYPPAKAAVRSLARIVRNELRGERIAVTYVDPGAVATEFMTRAGFAGPPLSLSVSPYDVARRIFDAVRTRQAVVNAVPWQTFAVGLGEALPLVTDWLLARAPQIVGGERVQTLPARQPLAARSEPPQRVPVAGEPAPAEGSVAAALAPQLPRMRRLNLSLTFVESLLQPGARLEPGEVALRWAGMPNKHERALTLEILDALAEGGFLRRDDERYVVLRAADGRS